MKENTFFFVLHPGNQIPFWVCNPLFSFPFPVKRGLKCQKKSVTHKCGRQIAEINSIFSAARLSNVMIAKILHASQVRIRT